jgi:NAD(P)-dependent dehydrogenase (short-subunit alcohol dehydrogenase family)
MSRDPFSLEGKSVLVTGASSGIGRQCAISCAALGARVLATGRDPARLAATVEVLEGAGHRALAADLTGEAGLEAVAAAAERLDGIAHCAGIARIAPLRMASAKAIAEVFDANFAAPILLTQRLLAGRRLARGASIVFVASSTAHIGNLATGLYAASKGALIPAARALALEVGARHGMRVNCISPGYVDTPLLKGLNDGVASIEHDYALAPLGLGQPEDVANAVLFLLSEASRWITRATLIVDGGLTLPVSIEP